MREIQRRDSLLRKERYLALSLGLLAALEEGDERKIYFFKETKKLFSEVYAHIPFQILQQKACILENLIQNPASIWDVTIALYDELLGLAQAVSRES